MRDNTSLLGVRDLRPAELADRLERLPVRVAQGVLNRLPVASVAAIVTELEPRDSAMLLEQFTNDQLIRNHAVGS